MNARILGLALLLAAHCDTDKPDDSLPHRDSDSPVENSPPDSEPGETGDTTESTADTGPTDADGDGWPAHEDCDDSDPTTYPDAADDLCDGIDHDCDGVIGVAIIDGVEHATIQGALDAIDDEGTVLVCPGTHTESLVVDDVASVTLESYSGSHEDTVLSGEGVQRILEIGTGIAAEVSGLAFVNGVATDGGAIWAEASSLTLQSCHFSDNQAVDGDTLVSAQGGAVYWQGNGIDVVELNIESCAFEGNTADGGGAIAAYWSRLPRKIAISDSAFLDNIASVGGGGGIEVWNAYEDTEVIIDSSVAERNSSAYAGGFLWGGVWEDKELVFTMRDSSFAENSTVGEGGVTVLWLFGDATVDIQGCDFQDNTATTSGAVLSVGGDDETIDIQGCDFQDNTATESGGVFSIVGGFEMSIGESTFDGNTSTDGYGGVAYLQPNDVGSLNVTDSTFSNNVAVQEGAIRLTSMGEYQATFRDAHFVGNVALNSSGTGAGALAFNFRADGTVDIVRGSFTGNVGEATGAVEASDLVTLTSTNVDWGEGASDNSPYDLVGWDLELGDLGANETFTCDAGGCVW